MTRAQRRDSRPYFNNDFLNPGRRVIYTRLLRHASQDQLLQSDPSTIAYFSSRRSEAVRQFADVGY